MIYKDRGLQQKKCGSSLFLYVRLAAHGFSVVSLAIKCSKNRKEFDPKEIFWIRHEKSDNI